MALTSEAQSGKGLPENKTKKSVKNTYVNINILKCIYDRYYFKKDRRERIKMPVPS